MKVKAINELSMMNSWGDFLFFRKGEVYDAKYDGFNEVVVLKEVIIKI